MKHHATSIVFALTGLALLLAALPAGAFQPANQNAIYEIALPQFDWQHHQSFARDVTTRQAATALTSRYGGNWRAQSWNPYAGTPRYVYGSGADLGVSVTGAAGLEDMARQVIADNPELFRADNANLELIATPHALGRWVAHFQQTYHGLEVWQGSAFVAFTDAGRLVLMNSDYYSDIAVDPNPSLGAAAAEAIATGALPFDPATDSIEGEAVLLVLPVPLSQSEVEHHLVWRVRVRTADPLGAWMTHVDAHTGDIVWRYNDIHFAYGGDTEADTHHYVYCDGAPEQQVVPYLDITVSGVGSTTSDENGDWNIAGSGGNRTVTAELVGTYCDVYNNAAGAEAFFSGTAAEDTPFTVDWDDTNSQQDERDVFQGVSEVRDYMSQFDPDFGYINQQIGAEVSINSSCNAYWDGNIHFYREAGGCANTGEMHQVVHHEFGHGVQAHILGSQGNEGLGEGNSDILGNLITQDNVIGRGFYLGNCSSGIRDSDNNLIYPDDVVGQQIHYAGQVIAGFNWDAMILLQDMYGLETGTVMSGERWHFGRVLLHPFYQPDQVFATFFADDDNGNMDDGTPHHDIFCEAAMNHNFDCPEILVGVFITHESLPYTANSITDYDLAAEILSLGGGVIMPGTVALHYRVDGGSFVDVSMAAGGGDTFVGSIAAQPWGSVVEYYLSAENSEGAYGTSPSDAPASLHYFEVNEDFTDEMEDDRAWQGHIFGDTAGTGRWERVDPNGTEYSGQPVAPEDDHTPAGTDCWITGQGTPGGAAGENDVDGGATTLLSPIFDLTGATEADISYWRWYTNNAGNNPDEDTWRVDISNDGGATWASVENTTASNAAWQQVSLDAFDYFTEINQLRMRFIAEDVISGSLVEAGVDDFVLTALVDATGVEDGMAVSFVTDLGQNVPNPFNPVTEIKFSLQAAGPVSLKVFDAQGRLVRTLAEGPLGGGEHVVNWNGRDAQGNSLASGVYFYRLRTEEGTFGKQMVLIK